MTKGPEENIASVLKAADYPEMKPGHLFSLVLNFRDRGLTNKTKDQLWPISTDGNMKKESIFG